MMELKELLIILLITQMCGTNFMIIHPITVEKFQSEPQMSTAWQHLMKSLDDLSSF